MVSFCSKCGTSLPYADVVFKNGEEAIAGYYRCPECKEFACGKSEPDVEVEEVEIDETTQLVIRQGECLVCRAEEAKQEEAAASESEEAPAEEAAPEAGGTDAPQESEPPSEQANTDAG